MDRKELELEQTTNAVMSAFAERQMLELQGKPTTLLDMTIEQLRGERKRLIKEIAHDRDIPETDSGKVYAGVRENGVYVRVVGDYLAGWRTLQVTREREPNELLKSGTLEIDTVEEAEMIIKTLRQAIYNIEGRAV